MNFVLKMIIECNLSMTVFITWASHYVMGVDKDSEFGSQKKLGYDGVGKDLGMVHE